jgi:hypothetical protein
MRRIPEQPAPRPWWDAPRNELGAPVPLRLLLARTETVVVAVVGATAFTTGVQLRLAIRRRPLPRASTENGEEFFDEDPFELPPFGHPLHRGRPGRELPPEILRFGVQFSDGGKATTVEDMFPWEHGFDEDDEQAPSGPVLAQGGGGGGGGEWESEFWLWPLPPLAPWSSWSSGRRRRSRSRATPSTRACSSKQVRSRRSSGPKPVRPPGPDRRRSRCVHTARPSRSKSLSRKNQTATSDGPPLRTEGPQGYCT